MPAIETIANEGDVCGECPLWSPNFQKLYWVDITGRRLHQYSVEMHEVKTVAPQQGISALALTDSADLMVAGSDGIWRFVEGDVPFVIAAAHAGEALAINDAIADPRGRLLAGSSFFNGIEGGYPLGKIYALDPDGTLTVLDDGFHLANGMGFSVDERTLYVTDSIGRAIYAYDYDVDTAVASNKRTLVEVPVENGLADGLTVDAEDHLWSANWFGGCVCRYDPDGKLERKIQMPAEQVSSVGFGGSSYEDLYVTSAAEWDGLAFAPRNYRAEGRNAGGQLFRLKPGVQGKPEYICKVHSAR